MPVTELPELRPWEAPRCGGRSLAEQEWWGHLTVQNYEHVGARIQELLGGYAFSVVCAYEYRGWEPELRAPVWLDQQGVDAHAYEHGGAGVSFGAGSYVYILSTWIRDMPPVRFFEPEGHGPARDVLSWIAEGENRQRGPHLAFSADSLRVHDRAGDGGLYWTLFQRLEGTGNAVVVLSPEEAAITAEALWDDVNDMAAPKPHAKVQVLAERIGRVFPGWNRWLPR